MTDQNHRPELDEQTFAKLIEAAYVLQEHNREMRQMEESLERQSEQLRQEAASQAQLPKKDREPQGRAPAADYTLTLAEIVEAQHQIQRRHLALDEAMAVVAERVARITHASGAGIGLLQDKTVRYRAGAGAPALPPGTEVPLDAAICAASVRTGQVIRSEDVSLEFLFDAESSLQRGIQSLISVPIYHDGNIAGALELYFDKMHGFVEQDVHTCQLMAGLVTEAIGRDVEVSLNQSVASERSTMLEAIEKLKPDLMSLVDQASRGDVRKAGSTETGVVCSRCGGEVLPEEQYCGRCGASRLGDDPSEPSERQRQLASAWRLEQQIGEISAGAQRNGGSVADAGMHLTPPGFDGTNEDEVGGETPESILPPEWAEILHSSEPAAPHAHDQDGDGDANPAQEDGDELTVPTTALAKSQEGGVAWTSAAKTREFLEGLAAGQSSSALARFWHDRRGSFYLAFAVILVIIVIRWGILTGDHSVGATGGGTAVSGNATRHKTPAPDADLSAFDKLLISLGLAEAPETPEYKGNPDVQVWVDLHTALYYCPGSELYGKTPKGKFASQRDAELDQFEPAARKACD